MVAYRRNFLAGGTYFFTVTLGDRCSNSLVDNIDLLRNAFRLTRQERPFVVDAIVVLPEHLHAILTLPAADADFSGRWRRIKSVFSRSLATRDANVKRNASGEYNVWQRRFWEHTIRNDDDRKNHVDYIHFNPVKHGLVSCVSDWRYSSFHRYVELGWLPQDWGGETTNLGGSFGERE